MASGSTGIVSEEGGAWAGTWSGVVLPVNEFVVRRVYAPTAPACHAEMVGEYTHLTNLFAPNGFAKCIESILQPCWRICESFPPPFDDALLLKNVG